MKRLSVLVVLTATVLTAGCARPVPAGLDPPDGEAEVGVPYRVTVFCPTPIELGEMWWSFEEPIGPWPPDIAIPPFPFSIWTRVTNPYAVPGIVTLATPTTAVFRADVDGSEFGLIAHDENPKTDSLCL